MLLTINGLLESEELASLRKVLKDAPFVDGRLSAGEAAKGVKNNEELDRTLANRDVLSRALIGCLYRNPLFQRAALPLKVGTPIVARYHDGMTYGDHVDDPVMGADPHRYRSDLSITVFLSAPEEYEGGELVIRTTYGEQRIKLAAGDAVLYPSSSIHRVEPVTAGERLVAITWMQSMVRDPARRELLFELSSARDTLLESCPETAEAQAVDRSYVNLLRMWSDT